MAHDAPQATGPSKLVVRNIGLLLSGDLERPILDADTIVAENGKITAIGRLKDVDTEGATTIVDAMGTTVAPVLIDSHVVGRKTEMSRQCRSQRTQVANARQSADGAGIVREESVVAAGFS